MINDKRNIVSVFNTNNQVLFQVAKSILDDNKLEYFSTGDVLNNMDPVLYCAEIKVFDKDETVARKLLNNLTEENIYIPDKVNEKYRPFAGYLIIGSILILISILISVILFLK